uniref:Histone H2A/H2B/H3 domain-containing protein n=1 Tax=Panagrolaimus sp. PS1159 TaxID=55785 RepID=A0AC35EYT5_9BILA
MATSRNQRRREVREKQRLAAERLNEEKRNEAISIFQQKYLKCTDSLLAQYGSASNMVSKALLHAAEEITQKLLRDSNVIAKKSDRTNIEPKDVNFASLNLYKSRNFKRENQLQEVLNSQRFPAVSNTALHYGPLQKVLIAPEHEDRQKQEKSISPLCLSGMSDETRK